MARKIEVRSSAFAANLPVVSDDGSYVFVGDCVLVGISLTTEMNVSLALVDPTTGKAHAEVRGPFDRVEFTYTAEAEDD